MHFGFFPMLGPAELMVLASALILVWPAWRICAKAGFPGPLGLLVILPVLNLVLLFFLGFAEWPSLRRGKPEVERDF
jgi:hypothetical protein